jgi:hypothetical protein
LKSRVTLIIGLAHAVVLALLGLAALLLLSEWPEHPSLTGVRRAALGYYLIANALLIEIYMAGRKFWPGAPLHFTLVHAGLSVNEVLLRSFAILNIGLAIGVIVLAGPERWWLVSFGALGIFAFALSLDFPDADQSRDWTIGDIIRLYAQESKRYVRWLSFMLYVYEIAALSVWVLSIALLITLLGIGSEFVYAAFIVDADPTWPDLAATTWLAAQQMGRWLETALPVMAVLIVVVTIGSALIQWVVRVWTDEPRPDPLSEVLRRGR